MTRLSASQCSPGTNNNLLTATLALIEELDEESLFIAREAISERLADREDDQWERVGWRSRELTRLNFAFSCFPFAWRHNKLRSLFASTCLAENAWNVSHWVAFPKPRRIKLLINSRETSLAIVNVPDCGTGFLKTGVSVGTPVNTTRSLRWLRRMKIRYQRYSFMGLKLTYLILPQLLQLCYRKGGDLLFCNIVYC